MIEVWSVYATLGLMVATFGFQVATRRFDPFAPLWLFLVGYLQVYVVQALSYHDWAVAVRGGELVEEANLRAFWALAWFLGVYFLTPGGLVARGLPKAPEGWSMAPVILLVPTLLVWGLFCAGVMLRGGGDDEALSSPEGALFASFPMVMLVAGVLLIVSGRRPSRPNPALTAGGIAVVLAYLLIWMFNGKRSHSLVAVLVGVCSFYLPRLKRPSFPILLATALVGAMAVGISIGWRYQAYREGTHGSFSKFVDFVSSFDPETILESINLKEHEVKDESKATKETEEYGGYLLMLSTVPQLAEYDYGANYLRVFSTFIPRLAWPDKPVYGRDQWVAAWIAGSEMKRDSTFTGPAIGLLGATQLNGGAIATLVVLAAIAGSLRLAYEYFRLYADRPWVQAWWSLFYYNAWFMTVNDDPCNWFYYNFGFTTLPTLVLLWFLNKSGEGERS